MALLQAIRGMRDLLPEETALWHAVEYSLWELMVSYGYQEIRMPLLEKTQLFTRGIGEATDIVEKEMYTFDDRNGESVTLRPESTAQCIRAGLEHGLFYNQTPRLWYYGPMFRYERPQKGRYRQFYQFGVETYGIATPDIDAEQILMMHRFWKQWDILSQITLEINSLGTDVCRKAYRVALVEYFTRYSADLDEDSQRRLGSNPLRILDSKNESMRDLINNAPKLMDFIHVEARDHFEQLRHYLDEASIAYKVNPNLVRGLDYYGLTVYEWTTTSLGAQGTVCGGGRYDNLVGLLGGPETKAVGFAVGMERLISLIQTQTKHNTAHLDAYFIPMGDKAQKSSIYIAEQIRNIAPHKTLLTHCGGGSVKSQFKKADKSGATIALIVGDLELENKTVTVKYLREEKAQRTVALTHLPEIFKEMTD
ncbi:MAG TPA: histidine--tRNA ligase [Gammaproteobacteria bacterium]|nr:histidine--tRNA ligase [Gammaproteobacteria bacterium]